MSVAAEAAAIRTAIQEMTATLEAVDKKLCRVIAELDADDCSTVLAVAQEAAATAAVATPATFAADLITRLQNLKTPPPSPK